MRAHPEALVGGSLPQAHLRAHRFAALLSLRPAHLQRTVRHKACSAAPALRSLWQRSRCWPLGGALALRQHTPQVGCRPGPTAPSHLQNLAPSLSTTLWAAVLLKVSRIMDATLDREASAAG